MLAKMKSTGSRSSSETLVALKVVPRERASSVEKEVLLKAVDHPFLVKMVECFQTEVSCSVKQFMSLH